MDCPAYVPVSYFSGAFINSLSLIACVIFAVMYFKDPFLSVSPGRLIASMELAQACTQLTYFSILPALTPFIQASKYPCSVTSTLHNSCVVMAWAYSACISLELFLKLRQNSTKENCLPTWVCHAYAVVLGGVSVGVILGYSEFAYSYLGCSISEDSLSK
jgi:hypothetical protein